MSFLQEKNNKLMLYTPYRDLDKIKEIPIIWRNESESKLNVYGIPLKMLASIIRLRLNYSVFRFIIKAYNLLPESLKLHHRLK